MALWIRLERCGVGETVDTVAQSRVSPPLVAMVPYFIAF